MAAKKKNSELISSLFYIAIGILLAVFPNDALGWCMTIVGALFVISGVLDVLRRHLFGGGISLVIGVSILLVGWKLLDIVLLVLGILLAVKGVMALLDALRGHGNALTVVFAVLNIAIGVFLAFFSDAAAWIMTVSGIMLAVDGLIGFFGALKR